MEKETSHTEEMLRLGEKIGELCYRHNRLCDQIGNDMGEIFARHEALNKRHKRLVKRYGICIIGLGVLIYIQELQLISLKNLIEKNDEKE